MSVQSRFKRGPVVTEADADCETIRFATESVVLGEFRCRSEQSNFSGAGRIKNYVVAFPRTAVWISRGDTRPFVADPGVATVYSPEQEYTRQPISDSGDQSDWFGVAESVAREIVQEFSPRDAERERAFRHAKAVASPGLYLRQRRLFDSLNTGTVEASDVEERGIGIVLDVVKSAYDANGVEPTARRTESRRRARDLAEGAKALIMASLTESLTVSEIAQRLHISPFHLCRTFRAATGMTMHEYRREMRVRTALARTTRARGRLSSLAVDLGFYSHSHFTAAFRRTFGTTPTGPESQPPARDTGRQHALPGR